MLVLPSKHHSTPSPKDGSGTCRPVGRVHSAHDGQQACSPQRLGVQLLADAWRVEPCRQHLHTAQTAPSNALLTL